MNIQSGRGVLAEDPHKSSPKTIMVSFQRSLNFFYREECTGSQNVPLTYPCCTS